MKYIRFFNEIKLTDLPLVGGKNASLGEAYQELVPQGVKVPNGYAITSEAYWYLLSAAGILDALKETLNGLDRHNMDDLARRGKRARDLILGARIPEDLWSEIVQGYERLGKEYGENPDVAVRSSATAEDLPTASFAGRRAEKTSGGGEKRCHISSYSVTSLTCSIGHERRSSSPFLKRISRGMLPFPADSARMSDRGKRRTSGSPEARREARHSVEFSSHMAWTGFSRNRKYRIASIKAARDPTETGTSQTQ